jgi:hypothetical protein
MRRRAGPCSLASRRNSRKAGAHRRSALAACACFGRDFVERRDLERIEAREQRVVQAVRESLGRPILRSSIDVRVDGHRCAFRAAERVDQPRLRFLRFEVPQRGVDRRGSRSFLERLRHSRLQ